MIYCTCEFQNMVWGCTNVFGLDGAIGAELVYIDGIKILENTVYGMSKHFMMRA